MKALVLALAGLLLVGSQAKAAGTQGEDNRVEIILDATVVRQCQLDLNPMSNPIQKVDDAINDIKLQNAPGALKSALVDDTKSKTVYETCNEDYKIRVLSANGGLLTDRAGDSRKAPYTIQYPANDLSLVSIASADAVAGVEIQKTLAAYEARSPQGIGYAPVDEQNVLQLSFPKQRDFPSAGYHDVLALEMSAP
jgi:hypothetical protein